MLLDLSEGLNLPFFFLFLLASIVYANTIKINNTFSELNRICIYNNTNTKLKIYLKSKNKANNQVCLTLRDYSGIISQKCDTQKVTITPDNLREKTIYYRLNLGYQEDDDYFLKIEGDDDGIRADECPSVALAKAGATTPENVNLAMLLSGVLASFIFFGGVVWALMMEDKE